MRLLSRAELKTEKGIKFTRQHLHRLAKKNREAKATAKAGASTKPAKPRFPSPITVGEKTQAWIETEIDQYIEECRTERDKRQTKMASSG